MRDGNTYRSVRREAAKQAAREMRRPLCEIWGGDWLLFGKKKPTFYRGAAIRTSIYMPHQGAREMTRRAH